MLDTDSQDPWLVVNKDADQDIIDVANGYDPDSQYATEVSLQGMQFIPRAVQRDLDKEAKLCLGSGVIL